MENVTRALIMAFSMLIFVIAFAYSMYLINKLTSTSKVLLESVTTTNYYDNIEVSKDSVATRDVGVDTIIPVLYRYAKETYAVKIYDGNNLIQVFDMNLEGKIHDINGDKTSPLYNSNYNKSNQKIYLFGAPWVGNDDDIRARIDYFLNGTKGYIGSTLVDYTKNSTTKVFESEGGFLKNYGSATFTESFVEYAYTGDTISTEEGLETITGNTQESSKIIITYTKK